MIVEGDCSIKLDPETCEFSVSGNIMNHVFEAGRDVFIDKYSNECVNYINSLQTTEEEAKARFSEFIEQKIKNGTRLVVVPVNTKKEGFTKAMKALKNKSIKNNRRLIFNMINNYFNYDTECYQKLYEAINNDPNFESALISHIKEPNKPELLICFVFSFTF